MFWDGGWGVLRRTELYQAAEKNDCMRLLHPHLTSAVKRINELIVAKGVEVTFVNDHDNGKTILHKACENGEI